MSKGIQFPHTCVLADLESANFIPIQTNPGNTSDSGANAMLFLLPHGSRGEHDATLADCNFLSGFGWLVVFFDGAWQKLCK